MTKRRLGRSDLYIAPLVFGGNVFGWTADEARSFELLDAFVDAGFNMIDTADMYSVWAPGHHGGESEGIIGKWLKKTGKRDKVLIATKCGMELAPDRVGLSRRWITQAVEDSLKRLQIDHIDLYQAHRDDPNTPLEETLSTFNDLVKQGKVRYIGASNYSASRLTEALQVSAKNGLARFESLQPEYNLYDRADYEEQLEPVCTKEEVGVISYFALARGFLSGKYRSEADLGKSARGEGVKKCLNERGMRILKALDDLAAAKHCTQAEAAIAWLVARPSVTGPIASATTLEQFKDLVAGAKLQLDKADIERLNQASEYQPAHKV